MYRTKLEISEAVHQAIEGNENPLEVYALLKDLRSHLDGALAEIEDVVQTEASMHPKRFTQGDWEFERREGRKTFNYKGIPEWNSYEQKKKDVEAKAKLAFAMYEKGMEPVDGETGEVLPLPEVKYSKDVLIAKPKK